MHRRSNVVKGCVNFPVDDPRWRNSGEGGMFVKLVVVADDGFSVCCGDYVTDVFNEVLIGDSERPRPKFGDVRSLHELNEAYRADREWESYHRPGLFLEKPHEMSRPYLASVVLGSTGWSGYDEEAKETWQCRYSDLNEVGKRLYDTMAELYPEAKIHLLTFLDT